MFVAVFLLVIIIFSVIIIFAHPQFSPIPYFPSNKADLSLIIKALNLKNNQTVIDLGAGDGLVIFAAANAAYKRKLNTKFLAVDINPVLILIMQIRRLFQPNKKNIKIIHGDMFKGNQIIEQSNNVTIYLYISPWYLERVIKNLKFEIRNLKLEIVSYMYPIKSLKNKQKAIRGNKHDIFIYRI